MNKPIPDALLVAIASGHRACLSEMPDLKTNINETGVTIDRTLLTSAAFAGNSGLIFALLAEGATIDQGNRYSMTALHEAASQGQTDAVEKLLDFGAQIEAETSMGFTPLMLAAAWGHSELVCMLIARGTDIHHRTKAGLTALMIAEEKEEEDVAAILGAVFESRRDLPG